MKQTASEVDYGHHDCTDYMRTIMSLNNRLLGAPDNPHELSINGAALLRLPGVVKAPDGTTTIVVVVVVIVQPIGVFVRPSTGLGGVLC